MVYSFCVYNDVPGKEFSRTFKVESNSLTNALKLLAFEVFRFGLDSDFVLCPLYICFSGKGRSDRMLTANNMTFFKKCCSDVYDSSVIIH